MNRLKSLLVAAGAVASIASANGQTSAPACVDLPSTVKEAINSDASTTAVFQNIFSRTSVRKFKQQPVEDANIEALLRAGMAAPTSDDLQPWHFVVLKDKKDIETYAASNKYHAEDIKKTPLFIFVCADTTRMAEGQGRELWVQDLSAVSENILLAANAMGLGACWTTIYPIQKKVVGISRTLKLPANLIPLNGIIIGYPDEPLQPKNKWDEKKITWGIPQ
ncbi:MAG: nitroreductase family protein [Prevotella sp.]|uniref:nitroreductase family protein n=1 Tax=Prevotella sp. TaxID=59823 RepID=UPI002A2CDC5F|nr:nitroreductase family protein [Prevotella sp.]MDD7318134.1 nitroreductase family protein [Prevotellaceae bacterium]MDY4020977.1 nitroreductase family protein [Prevotella sp.]